MAEGLGAGHHWHGQEILSARYCINSIVACRPRAPEPVAPSKP
jgi:hypothetical protein